MWSVFIGILRVAGFSIADEAIVSKRTGVACVAIHLQCTNDTIGGVFAMDDVLSFIRGTTRSRKLPKRCSAERETTTRGSP